MKKIYFSLLVFILTNTVWAQEIVIVNPKEINGDTVPFAVIEDVPVFPGCEEIERKERFNCFQAKINNHIKSNFIYPKKALKRKIEGRVSVHYTINEEGIIEDIQTTGGDPILQTEALRIMLLLPKMEPGKLRGRPVKCKHVVPITFKLQ